MTYTGTVKNGIIVLPPDAMLAESATVEVTVREPAGNDDPFLALIEKLAKPRPHWPDDYVINHGHYVSGEPRKS